MKKTYLFLILLNFFCNVYADCPPLSSITYNCIHIPGYPEQCAWSAPWYEGFPDRTAKEGEHPRAFLRAYWSTKDSEEPIPENPGFAVCFYLNKNNAKLTLVQNNWGGIPYPKSGPWHDGDWQGHKGRSCELQINSCRFSYP